MNLGRGREGAVPSGLEKTRSQWCKMQQKNYVEGPETQKKPSEKSCGTGGGTAKSVRD